MSHQSEEAKMFQQVRQIRGDLTPPFVFPRPVTSGGRSPYTSGIGIIAMLNNPLSTTYAALQENEKDVNKVFKTVVVLGLRTPFGNMPAPYKKTVNNAGNNNNKKPVAYSTPQKPCIVVSKESRPGEIQEITLYQYTKASQNTNRDQRRDDRCFTVEVGDTLTFNISPLMYDDGPTNGAYQPKQIIFGTGNVIGRHSVVELLVRPTPFDPLRQSQQDDSKIDGYCLKLAYLEELPQYSPYTFLTPNSLRLLPDNLEAALQRQADRSARNGPISRIMDPSKCWLFVRVPKHCRLIHGGDGGAAGQLIKVVPDADYSDQAIFPGCYTAEFPVELLTTMLNCTDSPQDAMVLFDSAIQAGAAHLVVFASAYKKDGGASSQSFQFLPLIDTEMWMKPIQIPPGESDADLRAFLERSYLLYPTDWKMSDIPGLALYVETKPMLDCVPSAGAAVPCCDMPLSSAGCASGRRVYTIRVLDEAGNSYAELRYSATGAFNGNIGMGGGGARVAGQRATHVGTPFLPVSNTNPMLSSMAPPKVNLFPKNKDIEEEEEEEESDGDGRTPTEPALKRLKTASSSSSSAAAVSSSASASSSPPAGPSKTKEAAVVTASSSSSGKKPSAGRNMTLDMKKDAKAEESEEDEEEDEDDDDDEGVAGTEEDEDEEDGDASGGDKKNAGKNKNVDKNAAEEEDEEEEEEDNDDDDDDDDEDGAEEEMEEDTKANKKMEPLTKTKNTNKIDTKMDGKKAQRTPTCAAKRGCKA